MQTKDAITVSEQGMQCEAWRFRKQAVMQTPLSGLYDDNSGLCHTREIDRKATCQQPDPCKSYLDTGGSSFRSDQPDAVYRTKRT